MSKKEEMYYQCRLSQEVNGGKSITIGYIEERAAKLGAWVELKGEDGLWKVNTVDDKPIPKSQLTDIDRYAHKTPDSLTNQMMKDKRKC